MRVEDLSARCDLESFKILGNLKAREVKTTEIEKQGGLWARYFDFHSKFELAKIKERKLDNCLNKEKKKLYCLLFGLLMRLAS